MVVTILVHTLNGPITKNDFLCAIWVLSLDLTIRELIDLRLVWMRDMCSLRLCIEIENLTVA